MGKKIQPKLTDARFYNYTVIKSYRRGFDEKLFEVFNIGVLEGYNNGYVQVVVLESEFETYGMALRRIEELAGAKLVEETTAEFSNEQEACGDMIEEYLPVGNCCEGTE